MKNYVIIAIIIIIILYFFWDSYNMKETMTSYNMKNNTNVSRSGNMFVCNSPTQNECCYSVCLPSIDRVQCQKDCMNCGDIMGENRKCICGSEEMWQSNK
jgi:hypothetical protein